MLDGYRDEENTPYSSSFGLCPKWMFQYNYELPIYEVIEIS